MRNHTSGSLFPAILVLFFAAIDTFYNSKSENHEGFVARRRRRGQPFMNQQLLDELDALLAKHTVVWNWVHGRSGDPDNERADGLAEAAAANRKLIVDATRAAAAAVYDPLEGMAAA